MNIKLVALGALVATAGIAGASPTDTYPYRLAVRAGIAFPIDSTLSDLGSPLLGLGVDYTFQGSLVKGGETYFSLDFMTANFGTDSNFWPVAINQKFYVQGAGYGKRNYGFVGLGVGMLNNIPGRSGTPFLVRGGFGTELGEHIFAEAVLTLTDQVNGFRGNSIGLYGGYRF